MRLLYYLAKIVTESLQLSVSTRKASIVAVVVIGLLLVALAVTAQVVAPLAMYPFA